ncbi:MAG TPA: PEGA domain-containing protein, partial [Polyangiales bacterium]|nr:PEGA domain-containing protein [Polyangiales bacterium]
PPSKWNRNIPSGLERIVLKALAKQPRDRYQTALEMRRELLAFMSSAGERCTRDDLGKYLREVFAQDYEEPGEGTTTIHSGPELAAARAAVAIPSSAAAATAALDGTTGLAAFDHLDPVSSVSFATEPIPSLRSARTSATLPPPGLSKPPGSSPSLRSAPQVPPIVPHPDSVPGTVQAADLLADKEGNDNAVPEPRPMTMDWDEVEPTTISQGFVDPVAPVGEPFVNDDEVTRVRTEEHLPGLMAAFEASKAAPPADADADEEAEAPAARPARQVDDSPSSPITLRLRMLPLLAHDTLVKLLGAAVGVLVVLVIFLYWSHERGSATIRMSTEPRDAVVTVDGKRVSATASPFVLSDLDSAEEHTIAVDKLGYQGWSTRLKLRPDQVLDLPLIRLEPDRPQPVAATLPPSAAPPPAASAPAPAPPAPVAAERPAPRRAQPVEPKPAREPRAKRAAAAPAPAKRPAPAAQSGAMGTLRINTRPWSRVIIDGKLIGNTPQFNVPLRAGTHTVNLVNPEFGLNKTVSVEIKAGQVVTKVLSLQ